MVKVLDEKFSIVEGLMTTIHSITSTQKTVDSVCTENWRLGRNAINNIIPTSTGAAIAVTQVLPNLKGKLTGMAFIVPTTNVSVVDLPIRIQKSTCYTDILNEFKKASINELDGIMSVSNDHIVSTDMLGNSHSCIIDEDSGIQLNEHFLN